MFNTKGKNISGFTLIELLVVVAIIGLLSSIVMTSLNSARAKARDAQRLSGMTQIRTALELYYNDNGSYPPSPGGWRSECNAWQGIASNDVIPGLVPTYIPTLPFDPTMDTTANTSCYLYVSDTYGVDYALLDHDIRDINFTYTTQPSFLDPTRDGGSNPCILDAGGFWSRKISSSGGGCW